ncbi:DUF7326 family protein [Prochlorococcus marinus]|uniref:Uncharacterized protein n=1 Tax=Prochlorococcus marinus (strain MIT 9211) TaxID=93059 RepID=A9BDZ5_PROM4|nr:hypothetical protein [Prochlorococcus marinus]ABX08305.1 Hypothetical protein P9211_03741 [Prochlorococcus marinus str. MIT 9211]
MRSGSMKDEAISFKDLSKAQLDALKDLYIDSRVDSMPEIELRKFVKEVLDLQVRGTVGNEEEREVWKEMKDHFEENFEEKIKAVIKDKGSEEVVLPPEEEEFKKRLEVLEQRKKEDSEKNVDMW